MQPPQINSAGVSKPNKQLKKLSESSHQQISSAKNKSLPTQQINAPNSAISIGQSGGVTAHTINVGRQERRVMPDQRDILIQKLKNTSIHPIEISYSSGETEQRHFAEAIVEALKAAGCEVIVDSPVHLATPYRSGVAVIINSEIQPKGSGVLQRAFKEAKIDTQWYGYPTAKRDLFRIIVSSMP